MVCIGAGLLFTGVFCCYGCCCGVVALGVVVLCVSCVCFGWLFDLSLAWFGLLIWFGLFLILLGTCVAYFVWLDVELGWR